MGPLSSEQAAAVWAQVDRLTAVNEALYAAASDFSASADMRTRVDDWHGTALAWQEMAGAIVDGSNPRLGEWSALGSKLATHARDLADAMHSDTAKERVRAFVFGFPAALKEAGASITGLVGSGARAVLWEMLGIVPWPVWLALAGVATVAGYAVVRAARDPRGFAALAKSVVP